MSDTFERDMERLLAGQDKMFEHLSDLKESHMETKTEVTWIKEALVENKRKDDEQDEAINNCHKRHDKIEGALKFGMWVVGLTGLTGAYKLLKELI